MAHRAANPGGLVPRRPARTAGDDCGCAMGGAFLVVALALVVVDVAVTGDVSLRAGAEGAGFVLLASIVGKATGLLLARIRTTRRIRQGR